jgi:hypothetical protein
MMTSSKAVAETRLWGVNLAVCIVHFSSATTTIVMWAVGYLSDWSVPVTKSFISWQMKNETSEMGCGDGNCFVKSAFATWKTPGVPLLGFVIAFHVLSFSWQFCVLWPGFIQDAYHAGLAREKNTFRWLEYSLSAPLMIIVVSAMLGEVDIGNYILLAVCTSMLMGLGYLQEEYMRRTSIPHAMGWILFVCTWAVPTFTFAVSLEKSPSSPPNNVLVIIWTTYVLMIFLFGCFGVVQTVHVGYYHPTLFNCFTRNQQKIPLRKYLAVGEEDSGSGKQKYAFDEHYYKIEWAYGILSATAKLTLAVLLILLIRARSSTVKLEFDYSHMINKTAI